MNLRAVTFEDKVQLHCPITRPAVRLNLGSGDDWTLLHHMAKRFYAPILVTVVPVSEGFQLRAVNDSPAAVELSVQIAARLITIKTNPIPRMARIEGVWTWLNSEAKIKTNTAKTPKPEIAT